jgi:hypothetical protein
MFSKLSTFVALTNAASWNYESNGADWGSVTYSDGTVNTCLETNQSPINLISRDSEEFDYKVYKASDDMIQKTYSNQYQTKNTNNGHTTQLTYADATDLNNIIQDGGSNGFTSQMAEKIFGATNEYTGV